MDTETGSPPSRLLSLSVGDRDISIDADSVSEVIRRPHISRVPNGPATLVGLCNLRGMPLPVFDMRGLLGLATLPGFPGDRIVVYERSAPIGLLVDRVVAMQEGGIDEIVPDLEKRLSTVFSTTKPVTRKTSALGKDIDRGTAAQITRSFLAFSVGNQTFGISLEVIREVIPVPPAQAGTALTNFREEVIPLVSAAALVGLPLLEREQTDRKIVVIEHDSGTVGLVVDAIGSILRLPSSAIDPVPPLLTRSVGTAELEGVGRCGNGKALVGILSPQKLFGHTVVEAALSVNATKIEIGEVGAMATEAHQKFLLFGLGEETYGVPLEAIDEVMRLPDTVTRVPNAPGFVLGIANLRGQALPLIDQRARFKTSSNSARPRAIVMTVDGLQSGFVVDTVSEVASIPVSDITASPDFASEATAVFDRVAHILVDGRMVLIVDPKQLLSSAERDLVSSATAGLDVAEAL